jgi:glycerate dehydrogenase
VVPAALHPSTLSPLQEIFNAAKRLPMAVRAMAECVILLLATHIPPPRLVGPPLQTPFTLRFPMIPPNIVVLDGYTTNPGDLEWSALQALGPCIIHDRTPPHLVVDRARDADILLVNKVPIDADTLDALPRLKAICILATGYNIVDTQAARARGIPVCNVPEYGTPNVAQAVFALLLELTNRTGHHSETVRAGRWAASQDFCYWDHPLVELSGLTLGIIGYGRIGESVAKIADAFGMRVLAYRRNFGSATLPNYVTPAALDTVFCEADVVSLHCPLTPETSRLINAQRLASMKRSAFLINTGRGPLIHESELADALNAGVIAGAGLDVLSVEPPVANHPLFQAKNCIITPHIAWATREARKRLLRQTVENVSGCIHGNPVNVVNDPAP